MPRPATYDDVDLVLRMYELRCEARMRAARDWFKNAFQVKAFEQVTQSASQGSQNETYLHKQSLGIHATLAASVRG